MITKLLKLITCATLFVGGLPLMISDQDTVFYNILGIICFGAGAALFNKWSNEYTYKEERNDTNR